MARTKDDIRTYAELGYLIYIDGYSAQITSMKPSKNQDGVDCWEIILNPTDQLIVRYGLMPNSKGSNLYVQEIPTENMVQLNADPTNTRWLALVTYKGEGTHTSKILKGVAQQEEIMIWKAKYLEQKDRADVAVEKRQQMENNLPKYIKNNFAPIMEQFSPMLKDIAKGVST